MSEIAGLSASIKKISQIAVPRALQLAERYRLLNEPEQAESICVDVLEVDPDNQLALRTMLLAISDQFGGRHSATVQHAQQVADKLTSEYERYYFSGVVMERWARGKLHGSHSQNIVHDWLSRAMEAFEKAEAVRPADDDSALLRWNTCCRLLKQLPEREDTPHPPEYGD